uniref:Matrix protein n=1 Tax=Henipavirus hendraense TaxID=3052223 RepID=A0A1L7B831_9MONO|nr:matrix [Henipavirus hendraense]
MDFSVSDNLDDPIEGVSDFSPTSWENGGYLNKVEPEIDKHGSMIPKYKIYTPGANERKFNNYMYMICYGFVEDVERSPESGKRKKIRTIAAYPLGVGKSTSHPQDLLEELCSLKVTVRRTAGATEKIVFGSSGPLHHLLPWKKILTGGSIFNAVKVCRNVDQIQLEKQQSLRIFFLSITKLNDSGIYMIPRTMLEFRRNNAIAFNLLVYLKIDADLAKAGIQGSFDKDGTKVASFMLHLGNFVRRAGKYYSVEYCKRKIDRMKLQFSLGSIGGLSLHIKINGVISKRLFAQMGFQKNLCFSLMDINPWLNRLTWNNSCEISRVAAVLQPSVPREFMIYDDVFIDNTGKILKG